jgi:hypothetical protein
MLNATEPPVLRRRAESVEEDPLCRGGGTSALREPESCLAREARSRRIDHRTARDGRPERTNLGNEEGLNARGFLPPRERDRRLTPAPAIDLANAR